MPDTAADLALIFQQAAALQKAGNLTEAAELCAPYRQCDFTPLLNLIGVLDLQLGHFEDGVTVLDRSLHFNTMQHQVLCNRGYGLEALGRLDEAEASYARAIKLAPDYARAYANHANVLEMLDRVPQALAAADHAIALAPNIAEAHCNRANALRKLSRLEEALVSIDNALALAPRAAVLHNNRGNILRELQRPEEALAAFDLAIELKPNYTEAHTNRGNALRDLKRYDEAIASHDAAITLSPDAPSAYWNKALVALLTGDYTEGWQLFERRWQSDSLKNSVRRFEPPRWDGAEDIGGKTLLVYAEQGYGDTVQFCRYVPLLLEKGAQIIFEAPRSLLPLLATLSGAERIRFIAAGDALPAFDRHIALMSLPLAFNTRLDTIPSDHPYLAVDPIRRTQWHTRLGEKKRPRIGLCWSGRPGQAPDRKRSAALADFAPLFSLPFDFHILQKDIRPEDAALMGQFTNLTPHTDELTDFADTAALIAQMDLNLSVDTSVAHVCGAIGAEVWLMLPWVAEWRWLTERADSPWYPTATLLRQPNFSDWTGLMDLTIARLKDRF
ncbi:MAG: tetratricopeptide repeat-containing glycosyltransferase family protein [Rhizomicrobium sp.]